MKITRQLAQDIVDKTMKILGKNINIMDENGIIIGSGNKKRLNQFHEGAAKVIKEKKKLVIYPKDIEHLTGAKPGINLPIEYNNKIIGVVGITGDPDEVSPFGEIIKMTVEMMLQQEFLLKEVHLEEQARENFVQDLISGRIGQDEDLFVTRGHIVGYDVLLPRVAMVLNLYQFEKTAKESLTAFKGKKEGELYLQRLKNNVFKTIQGIFINNPQDIVSYTGGDRFVVLKTIDPKEQSLREKLFKIAGKISEVVSRNMGFQTFIGIGEYYNGIYGISRSYKDAVRALDVGIKLEKTKRIYHINSLGIYKVLTEIRAKTQREIIDRIFFSTKNGKILNDLLVSTLCAFFDHNLSIKETAEAIFVHRNTLLYRLKKIKEITGLDPKKFEDAVQLMMALKMKAYQSIGD